VSTAIAEVCGHAELDPDRRPLADLGVYCLAGADLPADDRRIRRGLARQGWTTETLLRNDTFAVLRAGTERTWGVGVVCGFGTNCSAVAPDGRTFRLPALGHISGDWGGGADIGEAALWHSVRAQDGRGERTALSTSVPAHFGLRRPSQVMKAMYVGRLGEGRVAELPPLVFAAASEGDAVARSIVDRQADEVVTMANAAIRRLRMSRLDVHVVLGGGIFRNRYPPFFERIERGIHALAPTAHVSVLSAPPVVGAALLGLDRIEAPAAAKARVRGALTHEVLGNRLGRIREG
jgi:N-acetylglucosamine kinase-like BadF-type ATPase